MSYPQDKTYLEQIQENGQECQMIRGAYYVLKRKYLHDRNMDEIDMSIPEFFTILGEAIENSSFTMDGVDDGYHFMWDVLDELFPDFGEEEMEVEGEVRE